jgi:hypothetical protein
VVDDRHAVAQRVGLLQVVRGQEDRGAGLAQAPDLVPHPSPALGVEPGGRLVKEEQFGQVHQPDGHVEAALLAAGVGLGGTIGALIELHRDEQLLGPPLGVLAAHPVKPALDHKLLPSWDLGGAATDLADVADALADLAGLLEQVGAGDRRLAAAGRQQGGEHPQSRRLAGAVGAQESKDLALLQAEVDAFDGFDAALASLEGAAQAASVNYRHRHPLSGVGSS